MHGLYWSRNRDVAEMVVSLVCRALLCSGQSRNLKGV